MKFKTIFIANLAEVAKPLADLMNKKDRKFEIWEDHALCDRFAFTAEDNKLLITPFSLDSDYLRYAMTLLGQRQVVNLYPKKASDSLSLSILKDRQLIRNIINIIAANPGITIRSYAATREFIELINYLKKKQLIFQTPELADEVNQWVANFFDSKAGFRQISATFGELLPQMPEGIICNNFFEIYGWARYFIKKYRGCVLKTNRGLAGAGLKIIRAHDLKTISLRSYLNQMVSSGRHWLKDAVVVEAFIEPDLTVAGGAPNIELKITDGSVTPLYVCGMRITHEGVFRGIELGKKALPDQLKKILLKYGRKFGEILIHYGYRGFFEVDWVYGKSGKIYPIEVNLRRTGGTHVFEFATQAVGKNFLNNYYLVAVNIYPTRRFAKKKFAYLKKSLQKWLYPRKDRKEGVVITGVKYLEKGNLGYIVVGKDREQTLKIERDFLGQLN